MPGTAFVEAINPRPDPLNRPAEYEAGRLTNPAGFNRLLPRREGQSNNPGACWRPAFADSTGRCDLLLVMNTTTGPA
jgi:hypothetical protein